MVSCIVTTYRREVSILKRAINSIVNQSFKDIEIIVVNDAPEFSELSNNIKTMLDSYKGTTIQYIVHNKNMGACKARNTGLSYARGEYIAFLDDDDEWLPKKIEKQINIMDALKVDLVYCSYFYIKLDGKKEVKRSELSVDGVDVDAFQKLLHYNYVGSTSFPLIRSDVIREVGGFNTELRASQDHELWLKIAKKYKIGFCDTPLVNYFYSQSAISRNKNNKIQGYDYLLKEFQQEYALDKKLYNYRLNLLSVLCLSQDRNIKKFLYYWSRALKVDFFTWQNLMLIQKTIRKLKKRWNSRQ